MSDLVELLNSLNQENRIDYGDYSQLMFCAEQLDKENAELKEQIEKMKCCENCVRHRKRPCDEDKKFFARTSRNCNEWELAE